MEDQALNLVAIVGGLVVGLVIHEYSHVAADYWYGVEDDLHWFPDRQENGLAGIIGTVAVVRPRFDQILRKPAYVLRRGSMAPLAPGSVFASLIVFDVVQAGTALYLGIGIMMLCCIPSIVDFSNLLWSERWRTMYRVEIGDRVINHAQAEGSEVRKPW